MKYLILLCMLFANVVYSELRVASVFSDHMVVQRDKAVPVWGTANEGESISVLFAGQRVTTKAGAAGTWRVKLAAMPLNKDPQTLTIQGGNIVTLEDVLVGDVWLCAGQSNMKWGLGGTLEAQQIIKAAEHPNLRLLQVPKSIQTKPVNEFEAEWARSTPGVVGKFSAVGYIFGQRIHSETDVPIGLIMCAEGSTSVECWVSNETLENELFAPTVKPWRTVEASWDDPAVRAKHIHKSVKDPDHIQPTEARTYPGGCYNGMLHPLFPFAFKGAVWYQGEANRASAEQYRRLLPAMVREWRVRFEQDDVSFYQVQLPEIGKPSATPKPSMTAELREAQWLTAQQDPLIDIAIIIDSDQKGNVHPKNKQLPGERLARIALARDYGQSIEYRGPTFRDMKRIGGKIKLSFDGLGGGLMTGKRKAPTSLEVEPTTNALRHFTLAGADQVFHPAEAMIEGDTVWVHSDAVADPVALRYAWADNPQGCNFYNKAGLPAAPFRTDDWPCSTEGKLEGNACYGLTATGMPRKSIGI